jgi:hypothetical protein
MKSLNAGAPHFRSVAKQHRHANYTLKKVINEAVDNIIKKATEIRLTTDVDDAGRLQELTISDNYINGFESINQEGISNPFNMGHIKVGHDEDDETSEFGVGLKAGALSASNQLSVVSNVSGLYHEVLCDFLKMEKEEDVNASYNPKIKEITEAEYRQVHPYATGSSITMSKIRETICERMTQRELTDRIKSDISDTYSRFLTAHMRIFVNGEEVTRELDFFMDTKCVPFMIRKKLFVLEKGNDRIFLIKKTNERPVWQIYVKNKTKVKDGNSKEIKDKWESIKQTGEEFMAEKMKEGYNYAYGKKSVVADGSCMKIDSIFTFYSELFHTGNTKMEPEQPSDSVLIYKDDRKYGKKSLKKHNNGSHNYTLHRIDFESKRIGKELGITFNKDITMDGSNELIMAITAAIDDSRSEFNADTSGGANEKLCEKAVKRSIINWTTCNTDKLSSGYRDLRKKHEAEELRKIMEADIIRKKKEALEKKRLEDEELERLAEEERKRLAEVERMRLEAIEQKRLADLESETLEHKTARLAEEERKRIAEEERKRIAEEERKRLEEVERKRLAKECKRLEEVERKRLEEVERKRLEDEERKRLEEIERKKRDLDNLIKQQAESRNNIREASRLLLQKIEGNDLVRLEDSNSILKNIKDLLKL